MRQIAPSGAGKPAAATVSPTIRTTVPSSANGRIVSTCSATSSMSGVTFQQLGDDAIQERFEARVDGAVLGLDHTTSPRERGVGDNFRVSRGGECADDIRSVLAEQGRIVAMHSELDVRRTGGQLQS